MIKRLAIFKKKFFYSGKDALMILIVIFLSFSISKGKKKMFYLIKCFSETLLKQIINNNCFINREWVEL